MVARQEIEVNIHELNPFEGERSLLVTENEQGRWKKLEFDPTSMVASSNVLALEDNKIVLTPNGGGGAAIDLFGAIVAEGPLGAAIEAFLGESIKIETNLQTFLLNSPSSTIFDHSIQDSSVNKFQNRISKDDAWVEVAGDFNSSPTLEIGTSESAFFNWEKELNVSFEDSNIKQYNDLSGDSQGNAFSIWTEEDGANTFVRSSRYDVTSQTWSPPTTLNNATANLGALNCVIDSNSSQQAVALWEETLGVIMASNYSPSTDTWSTPVNISASSCSDPQVSINESDTAMAIWIVDNGGASKQVMAALYELSSWDSAVNISDPADNILRHMVKIDNSNKALVTYEFDPLSSSDNIIQSVTFQTTWLTPVDVTPTPGNSFSPFLEMDPITGNAICVFTTDIPGSARPVEFSTYDSTTMTWSPVAFLSNQDPDFLYFAPFIALNSSGDTIAVWSGLDSPNNDIIYYGSTYNGTTWSTQTQIYSPPPPELGFLADFELRLNENGNGVFLWTNDDNSIFSVTYNGASQEWSIPTTAVPQGDLGTPSIGLVLSNDDAIMTWSEVDMIPNPDTYTIKSKGSELEGTLLSVSAEKIGVTFNRIQDVATPINPSDATTKQYVDSTFFELIERVQQLEKVLNVKKPKKQKRKLKNSGKELIKEAKSSRKKNKKIKKD